MSPPHTFPCPYSKYGPVWASSVDADQITAKSSARFVGAEMPQKYSRSINGRMRTCRICNTQSRQNCL